MRLKINKSHIKKFYIPLLNFKHLKLKIKNMKKQQQATRKTEKKLVLTQIKNTPFQHATDGEKNYYTCGNVILETDKTKKELEEWLKEKPWEAIAMLIQAINYTLNNKKK